jgi:O-Antigen ligase
MQLSGSQPRWRPATVLLYGYIAALIALPSDLGVDVGWLVLTPARLFLVLGILAAIGEVLNGRRLDVVSPGRWVTIGWAVFLALAAASALISATGGGLSRLGSMVLEGAGVFWLAWWVARQSPRFVQIAIVGASTVVASVATVLATAGLRYDSILRGTSSIAGEVRFGLVRQEASFDAPLFYAVWLVAAGALALGLAISLRGRGRWLALMAWASLAAGVVTTASRFGITAVPAVAGSVLLAIGRWRLGLVALAVAAVIAVVPFAGIVGGLDQTASAPLTTAPPAPASSPAPASLATQAAELEAQALRGSTEARLEAISAAVSAVTARPVLGWGPLSAARVATMELGHPNYVDNAYLVMLIELGIAGLAAFLLLVLGIFRSILPHRSALSASQVVSLAAILVFALLAANFATSQGYALFWLVAGLAVATADYEAQGRSYVRGGT